MFVCLFVTLLLRMSRWLYCYLTSYLYIYKPLLWKASTWCMRFEANESIACRQSPMWDQCVYMYMCACLCACVCMIVSRHIASQTQNLVDHGLFCIKIKDFHYLHLLFYGAMACIPLFQTDPFVLKLPSWWSPPY